VSALCLLDLTAAFDTVDHQLLLHRLERQYCLRGVALAWFLSYLTDRSFRVSYNGNMSSVVYVTCEGAVGSEVLLGTSRSFYEMNETLICEYIYFIYLHAQR